MREQMFTMEQERADMIAEVEAQIERALASMTVGIDESDYASSRPNSRLSNVSNPRSRKTSDATPSRHARSFGTESTLAEAFEGDDDVPEIPDILKVQRGTETIQEDEEEELTEVKKKRFSASDLDAPQDGMSAVDEGISQKSENIAQKVIEIQQKVSFIVLHQFFSSSACDSSWSRLLRLNDELQNGEEMSRAMKASPNCRNLGTVVIEARLSPRLPAETGVVLSPLRKLMVARLHRVTLRMMLALFPLSAGTESILSTKEPVLLHVIQRAAEESEEAQPLRCAKLLQARR